jgi:hypothetical protein
VPAGVVDLLEVVDVDDDDDVAGADRVELALQGAAVRQAGEGVGVGLLAEVVGAGRPAARARPARRRARPR